MKNKITKIQYLIKQNNYLRFLLFGLLFIWVQTFWVSVIWRGEIISYILELLITDTIFVSIWFHINKIFKKYNINDLFLYLLFWIIGLVIIEWIFAGNFPGQTEANQFVMFTTWWGTILFAKMFTEKSIELVRLKKYTFNYFLSFTWIATLISLIFLIINPEISFVITYIAAIIGYPIMTVFFLIYLFKKYKLNK